MDANKFSGFLGFLFSKKFLKHFGIAIGSIILLSMIVFLVLRFYTHHGESVEVPKLVGMKLTQAEQYLDDQEMNYEVIDSVYLPQMAPGTIVEQNPLPKEKIKQYRKIYLVINSYSKPSVSMPDVRDLSLRNAKATLEAMGFVVAGVEYVPSEYKNLVRDVRFGGRIVSPGMRLLRGSRVTLLVGGDTGETEITVPSLRGLKYEAAVLRAGKDSLNIRSVMFDVAPKNKQDSAQYFVYRQSPITGTPVKVGSSINIFLTKDKTLLTSPEEIFSDTDSIQRPRNSKDIEDFNF